LYSSNRSTAIQVEGIFRISGQADEITAYLARLIDNENIELPDNPHTASGLLKMCLNTQVEPLFPFSLYDETISVVSEKDSECDNIKLAAVIKKLPTENYNIVKHIIEFLAELSQIEQNRMTASNCAIGKVKASHTGTKRIIQ
jgi:hypothetical protein